jgi:alkylation response protein AidB-like acyl-CoA dehydrogenase
VTFGLSESQKEMRSAVRRMCEERIAPHAAEVDRDAVFPWDGFKACVEMELPALGLPVAYGGAGADHVTQAMVVEELSRVCGATSLSIVISKLGMIPIMNWGTEDQKSRYLPRVASGESQASYCLSEPDAGSDVAAMRCRAVRDGDHYVLSGTKYWITNAGVSDIYTVFAKTDPDAGSRGVSCFIVEADWGVKVAKLEKKMGMRGSPTGEIVLDEVHVPVVLARKVTASRSPCTPSTGAGRRSARRRWVSLKERSMQRRPTCTSARRSATRSHLSRACVS